MEPVLPPGAAATAGPYAITASNAIGAGLANYVISYNNGTMTVSSMIASGIPELAGTFVGLLAGPTSSASGVTETCTESWCPW